MINIIYKYHPLSEEDEIKYVNLSVCLMVPTSALVNNTEELASILRNNS